MADLVLQCVREGRGGRAWAQEWVPAAAARLSPPGLEARRSRVIAAGGACAAVANLQTDGPRAAQGVRVSEGPSPGAAAILLGAIIGEAGEWWRVGADVPDGTYALLRFDDAGVELVSDGAATRTLWYVYDEQRFLASTSQRALVMLLGSLDLDAQAVAWLHSSGTLGPEGSWDRRVRRLAPDSSVRLQRRTWRVTTHERPVAFEPVARSRREHLGLLREALIESCGSMDIDPARWVLTLSGGVDSRTVLASMVAAGTRPRCLTWTTRASLRDPFSDAAIARLAARRFHAPHRLVCLDNAADMAIAVQRFVELGEARTDQFGGYMDGGAMWRAACESGLYGVIRGDEPFAARKRSVSAEAGRRGCGGAMVTDYPSGHLIRRLGLAEQYWPERLQPQPHEAFEAHRDRLSHQVYTPTILAALNELKGRYLEVVNPLLSRRLLAVARSFPEDLRMYGRPFYAIAGHEAPLLPYARSASTPSTSVFLNDDRVLGAVVTELASPAVARIMTEEAAVSLLAAMATHTPQPARVRARAALKAAHVVLPARLAARLAPRYVGPESLPAHKLAFRTTLASKMVALLEADAAAVAKSG